ncbi:conserved hypothetical protein (plasmid) [Enterococcus casseliflavus EC10]|nr:conserved hypothetical protein [Enterococcus casseliflavus EC10]
MGVNLVKKKLIILGNGFDLASGLKSRYYDFFSSRFNEDLINDLDYAWKDFKENIYYENVWFHTKFDRMEKKESYGRIAERKISNSLGVEHKIYESIKASELTFWDLVFYFSKFRSDSQDFSDYDWCDVEKRMLEFFQTPEELKEVPSFTRLDSLGTLLCLHLAYYLPRETRADSNKNIIAYFYDELRIFESNFSKYITEISKDKGYVNEALRIIVEISEANIQKIDNKIFSFNYTDPFSKYHLDSINVHGKAETNSILLGVDQESIIPDAKIFRFTKTFRQMTETKLDKNYEDIILPEKDEIQEIAFFGHSLSKFDYSYFQTIFDHYDLYNSSIQLVFYYMTFGERKFEDMELELAERISKMLYDYSPSIDNERKGRNLTHKLLLEKRLTMKEIMPFSISK